MTSVEAAADAGRLENVRAYIATLRRGPLKSENFGVGRGLVAEVVADRELLERWIDARRGVRTREEVASREDVEGRTRCRAIVDELARRLVVPSGTLGALMVELHDEPDDDGAVPESVGELVDIETVARRIGVSVASVRRLVDDNVLPKPIRLRRMVRWPKAAIDRWIRQVAK